MRNIKSVCSKGFIPLGFKVAHFSGKDMIMNETEIFYLKISANFYLT